MTASAGKLRGILGAMELGRRNLTADGPVSYVLMLMLHVVQGALNRLTA